MVNNLRASRNCPSYRRGRGFFRRKRKKCSTVRGKLKAITGAGHRVIRCKWGRKDRIAYAVLRGEEGEKVQGKNEKSI